MPLDINTISDRSNADLTFTASLRRLENLCLNLITAVQYRFVLIFRFRHFGIYSRKTMRSENVVMNRLHTTTFYAKFRR